jgi:uncharacterized membrane protein
MRIWRVVLICLVLVFIAQLASYYPKLPATVATHFGASGKADNWGSKRAFLLEYALPLVLVLFLAFGVPVLMSIIPQKFVNLPNKHYWFAPQRKEATVNKLKTMMQPFAAVLMAFLICVNQLVIRANLDGAGQLNNAVFLICLAGFMVFVIAWLILQMRQWYRIPKS